MNTSRTGGMTAMGILNIIFGSIGGLGSLLIVLGGGLLAAGGAAMEAELGADAQGMAELGAVGGGLIALIGIVSLFVSVTLFVAGIGLLKMAPWGRTLSIVCGVALIGINVLSMFNGIDLGTFIGLGYGILLTGLCFSETWKQAYSGIATESEFSSMNGQFGAYGSAAGSNGPIGFPGAMPMAQGQPQAPNSPQPMPSPFEQGANSGFAGIPGIPAAPTRPGGQFDPSITPESNPGENESDDRSSFAA